MKKIKTKPKSIVKPKVYHLALILVMLLGLFLSMYFYYGPSPINGADNYIYTDMAYNLYQGHFAAVAGGGVLAQQYLLEAGIALFYALLSPSILSSSLFGVLCFLLTMLVIYKIGSSLYNRKAGLLSAFFYSFNPIAVVNSAYVGDNGPMALIVSLCVLFLVLATRKNSKHKQIYYALAGFFGLIGILTTVQSIIILFFAAIILIAYWIKSRTISYARNIGFFVLGIAIALLVIVGLALFGGHGPFYILTLNSNIYSSVSGSVPQFNSYINWLFSFDLTRYANAIYGMFAGGQSYSSIASYIYSSLTTGFLTPQNFQYWSNQSSGLFAYFAIAGIIYLLLKRNMRFLIPALWFGSTLLYLGYGTTSITEYVPIEFAYVRLMLIFLPALALIIGFAATDVFEIGINGAKNRIVALLHRLLHDLLSLVLIGAIALLFANSLLIIQYINVSQYVYTYPLVQMGQFIATIPQDAVIYTNPIMSSIYDSYKHVYLSYQTSWAENCTNLNGQEYLITSINETFASNCNLTVAYAPPALLGYEKYNLFQNPSFGLFTNLVVYRH
ncbi:MAG: ArnT family glycosyltransferase [Candidatus Micrarchaeales archaeon]